MKIAIYLQESTFTEAQRKKLAQLGSINYSKTGTEMQDDALIHYAGGADILGADPDNFGGFDKAKDRLTYVMETLPNLKGVALTTTSFGWIDVNYCKKRKIPVCNVPGYSRESVAEHTLAMLLGLAKRIFITDRRTQKGAYKLEMGFELRGKTLGIIGLGSIGTATADLAKGIGMKVIAYNRTPTSHPGVEMTTLEDLLKRADAIAIHTTHEPTNHKFLSREKLQLLKPGVIIANTANHEVIDESAIADLIKSGKVDSYVLEAEDFERTPLAGLERVIFLKGFGWHTKEALNNLFQIFVENVVALAKGKPQNVVNK